MLSQQILGLSKDRKKLLIRWSKIVSDFSLPPFPQNLGVFDLKGKLLKVAELPASRFLNPLAFDWEEDDQNITILSTDFRQQNPNTAQTYLKTSVYTSITGESEVLSLFKVADSLQIGGFGKIYSLPENKFLMLGGQVELFIKPSGVVSQDGDGFSTFLMLVDKDKFTNPVSSEDVVVEDAFAPIVYPNPGSDALHISWHQSFTGQVQVADMQGKIVCTYDLINADRKDLDTCTWPSGMYVIQIFDDTRQVVYRYKWVKN